jgi:N-acetylglucosaminyldiphosphoundecaprenol N-acetyl-beta-D-mannosaminyltransferase
MNSSGLMSAMDQMSERKEQVDLAAPSVSIAGLPIANMTMEKAASQFIELSSKPFADREVPFYSSSANGQVIALCHSDPRFRQSMLKADQIHADGMPLVLFSKRFLKTKLRERIATTDLIHAVAEKAALSGARFYLLGASEDANLAACNALRKRHPGLNIVGRHDGFFDHNHPDAVIADILASQTDILWVGFGIPREQLFVENNLGKLKGVAVVKTAGGLFDFLSGQKSRAPQWMQDVGLEWLYRLALEPRRLGKRYLLTNPVALYAMLRDRKG